MNKCILFPAFIVIAMLTLNNSATAITVELAKKCRAMSIRAHPPTLPGVKTGTAQAERDYYRACVANKGAVSTDDTQRTTVPGEK
jgi:hypothetical protein